MSHVLPSVPSDCRVLALDGAGLYGYNAALWLEELCQRYPTFLSPGTVDLYAGVSAGALTCLYLAAQPDPRAAVLGGGLRRFWREAGAFDNGTFNPWAQLAAWTGWGGWFGEPDFVDLLRRTFGNRTLDQLDHNVLVCTFDWTGASALPSGASALPAGGHLGEVLGDWVDLWLVGLSALQDTATHFAGRVAGTQPTWTRPPHGGPSWKPAYFSNVANLATPASAAPALDLAYVAATPPGLRALRHGLADAASYAASPAAIATTTFYDGLLHHLLVSAGVLTVDDRRQLVGKVLDQLVVLSLGDGAQQHGLGIGSGNYGALRFLYTPTSDKSLYPPAAYQFQPGQGLQLDLCDDLLGPQGFHRHNPAMIDYPMVYASLFARVPPLRLAFLDDMDHGLGRAAVQQALDDTSQWLSSVGW